MKNQNSTVQEVLEIYKNAVQERNVEKFMAAYASDIHIYDCWGSWECKGKDSWRENVAAWFNGLKEEDEVLQVEFTDLDIEEGVNIGFAYCDVTYAAYPNGSEEKLRQMTNRFTFCLKKADDSWLITHEHSSLPINMENGKGMFNLK
ncbi:nuclear transport factor 2 family protein [Halobacillus rhizosphaerae]|uniref:YybH family protein n=1 Tax=Halobacillus rhizosphaerae TaxID=3064889 RepID=UPI00398AA8DD